MDLSPIDLLGIVTAACFIGVLIGHIMTGREWKEYCDQNDYRWYEYCRRLIEKDLEEMEKKHYDR